jgi:hypothetical protein
MMQNFPSCFESCWGRKWAGFDTYVLEQNTTARSCTLHDTIKCLDFTIVNGCSYFPYELRASIVNPQPLQFNAPHTCL